MAKNERRMNLPSIDDLFTTEQERQDSALEKIININIKDIDDYPNHPFKVVENDELYQMVDSIKEKGVLSPALVRPKADGKYEMISGHRRKRASELANISTIPCIVRELTDDEATIIMVDSNMQREVILPSEKAFAYKMKLDALKHQGYRTDLTSVPVEQKLNSREKVGKGVGESEAQIRRYIRLTNLIPELLQMVDNDVLNISPCVALRPAVELSYLDHEMQYALLDIIEYADCTPSHAQSIQFKKMFQENKLTVEMMEDIMGQEKPNQIPKIKISMNRLSNVLPQDLKNDREKEEYIIKAVEFYDKYQKKMREKGYER